MSIVDKIKEAAMNQFIEVIEWLDESQIYVGLPVSGLPGRRSRTAHS